MLITTVPSISIACIIFLIASLTHQGESTVMAADFSEALKSTFNISGWLLLVPVVTGILIARKLPAMITLSVAALLAAVTALIAQPGIIAEIGGGNAFKGVFISLYGNTSIETGFEALDSLVQTKGMNGMMSTIFLIFCASTFGGTLKGSGMIQSLTDALTRHIKGRTSLVASTVGTGVFSNLVAGDQYLSIILTTSLYKKLFEDKGYESRLLSRSAEDSATVTSVLIPWNSCGMTQSTVLKVPTIEYLPYCFFNLISPLMSILIAAAGYKITRRKVVP